MTMTINCITTMRRVPGQKSSTTHVGTTPYLHPHQPNDPKEKKLRYHRQGKKLRQTLPLLQTPLLVRSHLYWGSRLARVPSYKV